MPVTYKVNGFALIGQAVPVTYQKNNGYAHIKHPVGAGCACNLSKKALKKKFREIA